MMLIVIDFLFLVVLVIKRWGILVRLVIIMLFEMVCLSGIVSGWLLLGVVFFKEWKFIVVIFWFGILILINDLFGIGVLIWMFLVVRVKVKLLVRWVIFVIFILMVG